MSASLSPLYPAGEITYSETVQVTYKGIRLPGGTCNLMYFGGGFWGQTPSFECSDAS
ncbi:MAG: hypothetical protein HY897_17165 [Deltaproteobacteria bacterium]|nr:hypothetical protein [Deltaproteobacteria bacterium]